MGVRRQQVERFVLEAVADAAAIDVDSLRQSTQLLHAHMDSLTLVSVVARAEAAYGTVFDAEELAEILQARSVGDLTLIVARKIRAT